jgi:hypothetical protein
MSAPAAKVSKKELNSNHDGADETSGEERARRGPAAPPSSPPARAAAGGGGAAGARARARGGRRGGERGRAGAAGSAPFFVRGGAGGLGGAVAAGGLRGEAGALRPARRGRRRPPLLPPPSLSSPSLLPPEKPLFIVLRHDASLPSAAAATWCGRTRPRARPPAPRSSSLGPRRFRPVRVPASAKGAPSWRGVGARGARGRPGLGRRQDARAGPAPSPRGTAARRVLGGPPPPGRLAGPAKAVSAGGCRTPTPPSLPEMSRAVGPLHAHLAS